MVPTTEAGGPSGKAIGGVNGTATSPITGEVLNVSFQLNSHEAVQKEMDSFANISGGFFHDTADCIKQIDEHTVAFSGEISMTNENWKFFLTYAQGNGEPGIEVDWFRVIAGAGPDNTGLMCRDHPQLLNGEVPDNV